MHCRNDYDLLWFEKISLYRYDKGSVTFILISKLNVFCARIPMQPSIYSEFDQNDTERKL